jgi:hypothetical protein
MVLTENPGFAIGGRVKLAHQAVAVQDRECKIPPTALGTSSELLGTGLIGGH